MRKFIIFSLNIFFSLFSFSCSNNLDSNFTIKQSINKSTYCNSSAIFSQDSIGNITLILFKNNSLLLKKTFNDNYLSLENTLSVECITLNDIQHGFVKAFYDSKIIKSINTNNNKSSSFSFLAR